MIITTTPINQAFLIEIEPKSDERGFFARVACKNELEEAGISADFKQFNMQYNPCKGTLRGMHLQKPPYEENKLIRCTQGAIYDVIVDLREESSSYKQWFGVELSSKNRKMLYVPQGVAHGYLTLTDNVETFYMVTEFYAPDCERGVRYNDPAFGIVWPVIGDLIISSKDNSWPWVE